MSFDDKAMYSVWAVGVIAIAAYIIQTAIQIGA